MSIYQETPSSAFPLPVTSALNEQLGFTCQTVIVDNYTNQYLYFPDIARYVPPSTFGAILPYRPSNSIRATFTPPPGISPAIINTAQSASVTALAAQVPPSPGVSTNTTFNVSQGSVNANITNSTLATTVSGGTVDATITNATIDANITNSTVDINNATPNIEMSVLNNTLAFAAGTPQSFGAIPIGNHIRGWSITFSVDTSNVALYFGNSLSAGFQWWQGALKANTPFVLVFAPGLSVSTALNTNYIWGSSSVAGVFTLSLYHSTN